MAVLNRDGGTFKTTDLDEFSIKMRSTLEAAGHSVDISVVGGDEVVTALKKAAAKRSADVVLAGGGDGTVSAAAAILMNRKMALAILPAGTMNLFSRGIGVPQSLDAALKAFVDGEVRVVDMASANGRPFIHQLSIGLHARMVQLREKMEYSSRLGKIGASVKAAYRTVMNPPSMKVSLEIDGAEIVVRTTGIGISNNLFGEGHLPYADHPDGGKLGIYVSVAHQPSEMVRLAINMARGHWRDNGQVEVHEAKRVKVQLPRSYARFKCVIDGELSKLERTTTLMIHPRALNVLVPRDLGKAKAA